MTRCQRVERGRNLIGRAVVIKSKLVLPERPPEPLKFYTLQIHYSRTSFDPEYDGAGVILGLFSLSKNIDYEFLTRVDDYNFMVDFPGVQGGDYYYLECRDGGRYDGSDLSTHIVGDTFTVTVKENGFVRELKDIRHYHAYNVPGESGRAAHFRLTEEGTIISDPLMKTP